MSRKHRCACKQKQPQKAASHSHTPLLLQRPGPWELMRVPDAQNLVPHLAPSKTQATLLLTSF